MKEQAIQLFVNYGQEIVFLHVLSAIIWVGGMIAIRLAVHPSIQTIEEPKIKLGKTLMLMGKFFNIVLPFILILLLTAIIFIFAMETNTAIEIKEYIWIIMAVNFTWMYIKRRKAQKLFDEGKLPDAKAVVALIPKLLLPINIILGLIALWLGIGLRGL
ncbi:MAG: Unknown protein [uncultured Sulfurovum sp.]|uniref:Protoporphyrinogen IX oxidase n=1 Tax=uncultured Sulfurovum sp. TaxID=269237 RepID=A0A6S6TF84_9BACT|nr:MAG: Unknown protein [uncultured Sulfurovum sp.]